MKNFKSNKTYVSRIKIKLKASGALRAHISYQLWTCSLCVHCKTKTIKRLCGVYKKNRWYSKCSKIEVRWRQIFKNLIIYKPSLMSWGVPHKNLARSVQPSYLLLDTNGQTDKQSIYLDSEINPKDINTKISVDRFTDIYFCHTVERKKEGLAQQFVLRATFFSFFIRTTLRSSSFQKNVFKCPILDEFLRLSVVRVFFKYVWFISFRALFVFAHFLLNNLMLQ